ASRRGVAAEGDDRRRLARARTGARPQVLGARPRAGRARAVVPAGQRGSPLPARDAPVCDRTGEVMQVLLASPRGFCAGVEMAVEALQRALERFGPPLYVFHEIVHNTHVVQRFRERGAIFVDDVREVPEGACLLYSAHGVAPTVRDIAAERRLRTIDATCPLVAKVHREAVRYVRAGYQIVLIGHAGHDEVTGTMGEAPHATVLVESADDVDRLDLNGRKVAYLTQTTLSSTPPTGSSLVWRSASLAWGERPGRTSATPPKIVRKRCGRWPARRRSRSCWAAATAPTAGGSPSWLLRPACPRI